MSPTTSVEQHFVIDFDSTFTKVEALDILGEISLATHPEKEQRLQHIEDVTNKGMAGEMSLRESLEARIGILDAHQSHLPELIDRLNKLVSKSISRNKDFFTANAANTFIVSNGFKEFIVPVVTKLGIRPEHVFANDLVFNKEGKIVDFNRDNILSSNGGKVKQIERLSLKGNIHMIGDGYTDYEVRKAGAADQFYAYTENIERDSVSAHADHIAPSFDEILFHNKMSGALSYPKNRIKMLLLENVHPKAFAKLKEDGFCPFLDTKGWCEIHKQVGHKALSKTCQNYPKSMFMFGNQIEASISISCPSAAETVLLDPSAFTFSQSEERLQNLNRIALGGYTDETLPAWMPILRDFCFSVILFDQIPLEHRLFAMGMSLKQGEKHLENPVRLQEFLATAEEMTADGSFSEMYNNLSNNQEFKWVMFANQNFKLDFESELYRNASKTPQSDQKQTRFDQVRAPILELIEQQKKARVDVSDSKLFFEILASGQKKVDAYLSNHEHILINYILYYLFHNQFMFNHNKTPFQFFKIMIVDLFMQQTYLAGIAEKQGELTQEWLIQLFQTYARRRQHDAYFVKNMEIQLAQSNTNGAGDIFTLLK